MKVLLIVAWAFLGAMGLGAMSRAVDSPTKAQVEDSHSRMATMTGKQCELQAKVAYTAGMARNQGKSEYELSRGMARIEPDVATIIHATYKPELRHVKPEDLAVGAFQSCMKRSIGEK